MNELSDRLQCLAVSATLAMSQKSSELRAKGIDVINLSVGEPDFNTPEFIKEAAKKAIDENFSYYSPVPGYLSLRKAVAGKLLRENKLQYEESQIVCSNGAKQAVCNVLMSIINPGDEVIIPAPYWVSYPEMVKLAGGVPVIIAAGIEQEFKISATQLEKHINKNTKALILCSPSNPTGAVYTKEELRQIADVMVKYPHLIVISDEIYEHINYVGKHESLAQFDDVKEQVALINGVSKAYAMTGWRLGYVAAPDWLAKGCSKLQGQYTSGCSSIAQKAAEAAYNGPQEVVSEMKEAFRRRRDLIVALAQKIEGWETITPGGAFYIFPKCSAYFGKSYNGTVIRTAEDLALFLLEVGHVACVGGSAFGAPEYIRLSYATSDENIKNAMSRIADTLKLLR